MEQDLHLFQDLGKVVLNGVKLIHQALWSREVGFLQHLVYLRCLVANLVIVDSGVQPRLRPHEHHVQVLLFETRNEAQDLREL